MVWKIISEEQCLLSKYPNIDILRDGWLLHLTEVIRSTIIWDYSENEEAPARAIKNYASVSVQARVPDKYATDKHWLTDWLTDFVDSQWFSRALVPFTKQAAPTTTITALKEVGAYFRIGLSSRDFPPGKSQFRG